MDKINLYVYKPSHIDLTEPTPITSLVNGFFNTDLAGWTVSNWVKSDGKARDASGTQANYLRQTVLTASTNYKITFDITPGTQGRLQVIVGNSSNVFLFDNNDSGTQEITVNSGVGGTVLEFKAILDGNNKGWNGEIDNVFLYLNNGSAAYETFNKVDLDLYEDVDVSLNYSLSDIADISTKNSSYSKTIIIPGSNVNNKIFGFLFNISSDYTNFNPNVKTKCEFYVNDLLVIDGYLQLTDINVYNDTDDNGDYVEYNCTIYNNIIDLFSKIENKFVNELDISHLNHLYNFTNVINSWNIPSIYTQQQYIYPIYWLDNPNSYELKHFKPALFVKPLVDSIFAEAGFSYQSEFFNTDFFKSLIIPYTGEDLKISDEEIARRGVIATCNGYQLGWLGNIRNVSGSFTDNSNYIYEYFHFYDTDNDGAYDVFRKDIGTYYARKNGKYNFTLEVDFTYGVKLPENAIITNTGVTTTVLSAIDNSAYSDTLHFKIFVVKNVSYLQSQLTKDSTYKFSELNGGTNSFVMTNAMRGANNDINNYKTFESKKIKYTFELTLAEGEQVNMLYRIDENGGIFGSKFRNSFGSPGNPNPQPVNGQLTLGCKINSFTFTAKAVQENIMLNDEVDMNQILPAISQSELLSNIFKMFNLYSTVSSVNSKQLVIEPRDDFYSASTEIIDWTNKLDRTKGKNIKFISQDSPSSIRFTYSDGDDKWNKERYKEITKETYGQHYEKVLNEFNTQAMDISVSFIPTPILKNSMDMYLPAIDANDIKSGIRILQYGGISLLTTGYFALNTDATLFSGTTLGQAVNDSSVMAMTMYPVTLHQDMVNAAAATDINWGVCDYYQYDVDYLTNNNLYNKYWSSYIELIKNGKMLTAYFDLSEIDINQLDFAKKVKIGTDYFILNNIFDYNPINRQTTKVELIKVDATYKPTITVIRPSRQITDIALNSSATFQGIITQTSNNTCTSLSPFNNVTGNNIAIGTNSNNNLLDGDGIQVGTNSSNNSVLSSTNVIIGPNVTGSVVIGANGITVTESNTIYIGSTTIIDSQGNVSSQKDIIDGMKDAVYDEFADDDADVVAAGKDTVRFPGASVFKQATVDAGNNIVNPKLTSESQQQEAQALPSPL